MRRHLVSSMPFDSYREKREENEKKRAKHLLRRLCFGVESSVARPRCDKLRHHDGHEKIV